MTNVRYVVKLHPFLARLRTRDIPGPFFARISPLVVEVLKGAQGRTSKGHGYREEDGATVISRVLTKRTTPGLFPLLCSTLRDLGRLFVGLSWTLSVQC